MSAAVVIAARRTALARLDGDLASVPAEALAATVIRALVDDTAVAPGEIDDVIVATAAGPGGNMARRALLDAGLDVTVPGMTVDRQCGGGLDAIVLACRLVEAGAGDLYIAGGVESATRSPMRREQGVDAGSHGRRFFPRRMFSGGGHEDPGMAESAEIVAAEWTIGRERQDAFAARSHARAVAATTSGAFDGEIVPMGGADGADVRRDSCPRPTLTAQRLARFPPIVRPGGSVTAGNASQIADGAAFVMVASQRRAVALGRTGLVHVGSATAGTDPRHCGMGAVAAVERLARRHPELRLGGVAQVAFTEAFASQVLATADVLGLDEARLNPHGGAIALGHPWGASGAVQVVRLFADLSGSGPAADGLALAAIAGGMGTASWFRAGVT